MNLFWIIKESSEHISVILKIEKSFKREKKKASIFIKKERD